MTFYAPIAVLLLCMILYLVLADGTVRAKLVPLSLYGYAVALLVVLLRFAGSVTIR